MDFVIDLSPAQIGMFLAFSITTVGIGMALKRRAMRKKQQNVKQDVEEYEFKSNPETLAPERVEKNPQDTEQPKDNQNVDDDALLKDLKDKREDK